MFPWNKALEIAADSIFLRVSLAIFDYYTFSLVALTAIISNKSFILIAMFCIFSKSLSRHCLSALND